jgi:hypothetical protein
MKPLGIFGTIVMVGPYGSQQYTIAHPIGYTDLDDDDWVLFSTEEVPAILNRARSYDPSLVNKERANEMNSLLVEANLLVQREQEGKTVYYYPEDTNTPRNSILDVARAEQKGQINALKVQLAALPKKGSGVEKQVLHAQIQSHMDLVEFLPNVVKAREIQIRNFRNDAGRISTVNGNHPHTNRTRMGRHGNVDQRAITGAKGKTLSDVIGALSNHLEHLDLSAQFGRYDVPIRSETDTEE